MTLTSSDGQPVHVVGQTGFSNGTEVFAVVLNTPDAVMLSAVAGPANGASGVITIKPQAMLSSFVVSPLGMAIAGTAFNVAVTAEDNYGNIVTSFNGSVTLTASDGQTVHLLASPAFSNGTAILTVTLDTADTLTLTAASGAIEGTSPYFINTPAALSTFVVSAPAVATVGTGFSVVITARDCTVIP